MISIIIPTLNEAKFVGGLLEDLSKQTYKDFEIIIADAASTDGTLNIAKKYNAKIVPGGLPSIARNNGAKVSNGEYLIFMDADVRVQEDFLKEALTEIEKRKVILACFSCNYKLVNKSIYKLSYWFWNIQQRFLQFTFFTVGSSQVMMIKKKDFEFLNGFDEDLLISEDIDIIKRTAANGLKYRVLDTHYVPSPRRFEKYGILKTNFIGLIGAITVIFKLNILNQKVLERLYGGWNNY